jgi:hypothetical protein
VGFFFVGLVTPGFFFHVYSHVYLSGTGTVCPLHRGDYLTFRGWGISLDLGETPTPFGGQGGGGRRESSESSSSTQWATTTTLTPHSLTHSGA